MMMMPISGIWRTLKMMMISLFVSCYFCIQLMSYTVYDIQLKKKIEFTNFYYSETEQLDIKIEKTRTYDLSITYDKFYQTPRFVNTRNL